MKRKKGLSDLRTDLEALVAELDAARETTYTVAALEDELIKRYPAISDWLDSKADYHQSIGDDLNEMANDISRAAERLLKFEIEDKVRRARGLVLHSSKNRKEKSKEGD